MFLKISKFIFLILFIIFVWQYGQVFNLDADWFGMQMQRFPLVLSAIIFIALYVGITFFAWLAKDFFKIAGAISFGPYWSTLFIWIAETMSATLLFYVSRYLGRDFVQKYILRGRLVKVDQRIARVGAFELFALRAFPLIPFRFLDLTAGLTKIPFRFYFLFVVLASPLRIFWVQFILAGVGKTFLKDPGILISYLTQHTFVFTLSFIYLLGSLVFIIFRGRKYRKREGNGCL